MSVGQGSARPTSGGSEPELILQARETGATTTTLALSPRRATFADAGAEVLAQSERRLAHDRVHLGVGGEAEALRLPILEPPNREAVLAEPLPLASVGAGAGRG